MASKQQQLQQLSRLDQTPVSVNNICRGIFVRFFECFDIFFLSFDRSDCHRDWGNGYANTKKKKKKKKKTPKKK